MTHAIYHEVEERYVRGEHGAEAFDPQEVARLQAEYDLDYFAACLVAATEMDGVAEGATVHAVQTYCDQLNYSEDARPSPDAIEAAREAVASAIIALKDAGLALPEAYEEEEYDEVIDQLMEMMETLREAGVELNPEMSPAEIAELYRQHAQ